MRWVIHAKEHIHVCVCMCIMRLYELLLLFLLLYGFGCVIHDDVCRWWWWWYGNTTKDSIFIVVWVATTHSKAVSTIYEIGTWVHQKVVVIYPLKDKKLDWIIYMLRRRSRKCCWDVCRWVVKVNLNVSFLVGVMAADQGR